MLLENDQEGHGSVQLNERVDNYNKTHKEKDGDEQDNIFNEDNMNKVDDEQIMM